MNDRELLELAAKAIGTVFVDGESWDEGAGWNPLTDDGDALRLAVKLKLLVMPSEDGSIVLVDSYSTHEHRAENAKQDPYAATRRVIVRAAAEIGKGMK